MADKGGTVQYEPNMAEVEVDLREYIQILYKRRWVIVSITLLAVLFGGIVSFFVLPPVYSAQVTLQMTPISTPPKTPNNALQSFLDNLSTLPQISPDSYVAQITSPTVLQRVIDTLHLDRLGYRVATLAQGISARSIKGANLIEVAVEGKDPKLVANIANAVGREATQVIAANGKEQMEKSTRVLDEQLTQAGADLQDAIDRLNQFQSQPEGVPLLQQKLRAEMSDLGIYESRRRNDSVQAQRLQAGIEQLSKALQDTPKTLPGQVFTGNGMWMQETNPTWVELSRELAEKQVALSQSLAEEKALAEQMSRLEADIQELQVRVTTKQSEQAHLQADVDRLTAYRQSITQKIYELKVANATQPAAAGLQVVSAATVPDRPVKPHKSLNLAIAAVLGFMVSLFVVFLLENLAVPPKPKFDQSV